MRNYKLNLVRLSKKYSHEKVYKILKLYDLKKYGRSAEYYEIITVGMKRPRVRVYICIGPGAQFEDIK